MAKDELRSPDTRLGVTLDGNSRSVVFDTDGIAKCHLDTLNLLGVSCCLVECIYQNFVKNLEQTGAHNDRSQLKLAILENPVLFSFRNDRTDIRVRSFQNMLNVRELLIHFYLYRGGTL